MHTSTSKINIIIDNSDVTLRVYPDKKIVHHEIHQFIYGETYRELMLKGADAFEKHHCTKWLSDDRGSSALRREDIEWATSFWEPRIMKAGWKYWALILPEKVIGQLYMKRLVERGDQQGITVQLFSDPAKAMAWLGRQ